MENFKIEKPYPLYKLVQEEVPDKHSHSCKCGNHNCGYNTVYTIYVKVGADIEWYELYNTFSKPWAEIALNKLKDIFNIHINRWLILQDEPTMFDINDQIYKTEYVFPNQSCICGSSIKGNARYGEFSVEPLKFDYIQSTIFFYYKGDCLLKCNQLFLDGKLLLNSAELKNVCDDIGQDISLLDSSPNKLLNYIANNYEDANTFSCNGYSSFNIKHYK